jgi:hypothetical protein
MKAIIVYYLKLCGYFSFNITDNILNVIQQVFNEVVLLFFGVRILKLILFTKTKLNLS